MRKHRTCGHRCGDSRPPKANHPLDLAPRQTVQHEEPHNHERRKHMEPVDRLADRRFTHANHNTRDLDARECNTGCKQRDRRDKGCDSRRNRARIRTVRHVSPMQGSEHNRRHDECKTKHKVRKEVPKIELPLMRCTGTPFEKRDG